MSKSVRYSTRRRWLGVLSGSLLMSLVPRVLAQIYPSAPLLQNLQTVAPLSKNRSIKAPSSTNKNLLSAPSNSYPNSPYPPYQVISTDGNVQINGLAAKKGSVIAVDDEIKTDSTGVLVYRWLNEIVKVYPNSRLVHGDRSKQWLNLNGRLTLVSKASSYPRVISSDFVLVQLDTSTLHIDTHRQIYNTNGLAVDVGYVCVCFGKASLALTQNTADVLRLNAHHHNFPHFAGPRHFRATKEVLGHDDDELVLLQSILQEIG